ncbi:hypothetical protein QQ008_11110 [Fulvivirgaceae bacterium BMA10]|uniref:Uncharacterized protein n=1 Tax=Splendidivirga corallicola TaxID=3051826 RepID=A0ABT8KMG9_9BACT|nr:hypothetical protein [Fulvivirgaceae bacterium BMA10]
MARNNAIQEWVCLSKTFNFNVKSIYFVKDFGAYHMKYYLIIGILLVLSGCKTEDESPASNEIDWVAVRSEDQVVLSASWENPTYLSISELGWIESIHASPDGTKLWYMFYPGKDLASDARTGEFVDDTDIYTSIQESDGDFKFQGILITPSIASEDKTSASGTMVDEDGNIWYNSNHEGLITGDFENENIYRNNELLNFNEVMANYGNPHYCKAKDELWFDRKLDSEIAILKNAAANDFSGTPVLAPAPINSTNEVVQDNQAWLSKDGNTLYFTSNRHKIGEFFDGPGIFKSIRMPDDSWTEPELVITSRVAVGDACLNEVEDRLFYVQHFEKDNQFRTGVFYVTLK